MVLERFFRRVHQAVEFVLHFDLFAALFVIVRELLGLFHKFLHLILREFRRRGDADRLFLVRAEIFRGHVQDPVGVEVKRHLNLGRSAGGRRNTVQDKLSERHIVFRQRTFALQHMDFDRRLIVCRRRENL